MGRFNLKDKLVQGYVLSVVGLIVLGALFMSTLSQRAIESQHNLLIQLFTESLVEDLRFKANKTKTNLEALAQEKHLLSHLEEDKRKEVGDFIDNFALSPHLDNLYVLNAAGKIIFQKKAGLDSAVNSIFLNESINDLVRPKIFLKFQREKIYTVSLVPVQAQRNPPARRVVFAGVSALTGEEALGTTHNLKSSFSVFKEDKVLFKRESRHADELLQEPPLEKTKLKRKVNLIEELQRSFPQTPIEGDINYSNGVIHLAMTPHPENQPNQLISFTRYLVMIFLFGGIGVMTYLFSRFYFKNHLPFLSITKRIRQINQGEKHHSNSPLKESRPIREFSHEVNTLLKKVSKSFSILDKINSLEKEISYYLEEKDLCILITHTALKVAAIENVAILLKKPEGNFQGYTKGDTQNKGGKELNNLSLAPPLSRCLSENKITSLQLDQSVVYPGDFYISSGSDVSCYPLLFGGEAYGILCIWNETSKLMIEEEQRFFLQALVTATASQLENIKLVTQIKEKTRFEEEVKAERRIASLKAEQERLRQLGSLAVRMGDKVNTPLQAITIANEELREILGSGPENNVEALDLLHKSQGFVERISHELEELKKYRKYSNEWDLHSQDTIKRRAVSKTHKESA